MALPHPPAFPLQASIRATQVGGPLFFPLEVFLGDPNLHSCMVALFCAPVIFVHITLATPTTLLYGYVSVPRSRLSSWRADTETYLALNPQPLAHGGCAINV